ncbi:hypothetical protein Tco_1497750, partial [Tanacetum coccineum]
MVIHAVSPVADTDHIMHECSSEDVVTNHLQIKLSRVETVHGEFSRAAGVPAGGSRHPGLADEAAPQRHRISRHRVRRRRRQPSAP